MRRTYRTLNGCEMQCNAEVGLFTKPSNFEPPTFMKVLKSTKLNSQSLTTRVYDELRKSILTGKIKEGTRLVESTLAHCVWK